MADLAVLQETLQSSEFVEPFGEKTMLYVIDQNNGAYNGSIQFDTSNLSSSKRHTDYQNAFIEIPFVIAMSSSVSAVGAGVINSFVAGLKAGAFQLIDGLQVDFQNTNVIQSVPFSNFAVSYRLLESWGQDDLLKHGASTLFIPDSSTSTTYRSSASASGIGHCNNVVSTAQLYSGATFSLNPSNTGFGDRLRETSYDLSTANSSSGYGALPSLNSTTLCNNVGKSYLSDDAGSTTARIWKWNIMATIRLRDLHDFFEKMPLMKGTYMRFNINYNACRMTIPCLNSGTTMGSPTYTQLAGRTCPIMISSGLAGNPNFSNLALADHVLSIEANVVRTTSPLAVHNIMTNCRLYVPSYALTEATQQELYAIRPTKKIIYEEIYNFNVLAVAAGASFNNIISNGIVNPTKLLVIPVINSASNASINPALSPYDSAPACGTTPCLAISNFNVLIAGKAVYQQNVFYDWEMWMNEVNELGLNGGKTAGLTSGLISRLDWSNGMRYYVSNLSRRSEIEKSVPVSIQIQGTNNSAVIADYYVFVFYEKTLEVNLSTSDVLTPSMI